MIYTTDQLGAIDITRLGSDACVVAGPGSGKTTVLVERYGRLVESGISPSRILAITFTEKAAANMKTKLAEKFAGEAELRSQMEKAYVSTIHGFCNRLIRENAIAAGVDPQFSILDEPTADYEQRRCLGEALDALLAERHDDMLRLLRRARHYNLHASLRDTYEAIRCAGVELEKVRDYAAPGPVVTFEDIDFVARQFAAAVNSTCTPKQREHREEVLEWNGRLQEYRRSSELGELLAFVEKSPINGRRVPESAKPISNRLKELCEAFHQAVLTDLVQPERDLIIDILQRFDALYQDRKRELSMLDFSDLEHIAAQLLERNAGVRARVQNQFHQIMMDEFQDTNGMQARLLNLLRAPQNFYAVGDINQSIFGFRHASPEIFRAYRDQVVRESKHHASLKENFRSRAEVLRAVETILDQAPGIETRRLIPARELPAKPEPSVDVFRIKPSDDSESIEALWIARRILELRDTLRIGTERRRPKFQDFAVLARKADSFEPLVTAFDQLGIPHVISRPKGFFAIREILDITHLLRTVSNPRDEIATAALLRSPMVGVSDESLFRLKLLDKNIGGALAKLDAVESSHFDAEDLARLRFFRRQLAEWRALQPYLSLDRLLLRALADSGFEWEPASGIGSAIEKFLGMARQWKDKLAEFVEYLARQRESNLREAEVPFDDAADAVRMMTAHTAKGLEFPIVILPAMDAGIQKGAPNFSFTPEFGLGSRWNAPPDGGHVDDLFHAANRQLLKQREEQESNRLLYVALTRAEEHLVLSYTRFENWAKVVAPALEIGDPLPDGVAREHELLSPYAEPFRIRVVCALLAPDPLVSSLMVDIALRALSLPRPVLQGPGKAQHDANVTVTALSTFAHCPRKYLLAQYLGLEQTRRVKLGSIEDSDNDEDPETSEISASERGKQVHALLAGVTVENPDWHASRLARTFELSSLGKRAARAKLVEHEFSFLLAVDDVVISGQIDLWFEDGGELVLADYKTDDVTADEANAHAQIYALQIQVYAAALQAMTGRAPDRAFIHLLVPDKAVEIPLAPDAVAHAVRSLSQAQAALHFPLNEGPHCRRCQFYRGLCPAGRSPVSEVIHAAPVDGQNLAGNEAGVG